MKGIAMTLFKLRLGILTKAERQTPRPGARPPEPQSPTTHVPWRKSEPSGQDVQSEEVASEHDPQLPSHVLQAAVD